MRHTLAVILGLVPVVSAPAHADDQPTAPTPPADSAPAPIDNATPPADAPAPPPTTPAAPPPAPAPTPAVATAPPPAAAITDAAKPDANAEKEAFLEARLADHAIVNGEVGIGLQLASNSNGASPIITVDVTAFHPVWARLRGRGIGGSIFIDSLVGYSVRHSRDFTTERETITETVGETNTHYIKQISQYSNEVVGRNDLVIAAGLKHEYAYDDRDMDPMKEGTGFHSQILMVGAQKHFVTSEGAHDYIELYGLYNRTTGGKGFQAIWHNSASFLPTILGRRMYGGMELAWVPTDAGGEYYFGIVDIGISWEI